MGLLSIFKRKSDATHPVPDTREAIDDVTQARTRARRRLIGAFVLVAIGIIGFPLVFETQPRPIPIDIPIEIPRKEAAPELVMPRPSADAALPRAAAPVEPAASEEVITESRAETESSRDLPPAPAKTAEATPAKPAPPGPADDAARAQALLEGKVATAKPDASRPDASASRFIVQVGAFAEAAAARDARQKAEKLGLKTYTQVTETPTGSRIRVRVGPFASRDDADKALAKARAAGLSGVVLTL